MAWFVHPPAGMCLSAYSFGTGLRGFSSSAAKTAGPHNIIPDRPNAKAATKIIFDRIISPRCWVDEPRLIIQVNRPLLYNFFRDFLRLLLRLIFFMIHFENMAAGTI